jgi:hypothetical protein
LSSRLRKKPQLLLPSEVVALFAEPTIEQDDDGNANSHDMDDQEQELENLLMPLDSIILETE